MVNVDLNAVVSIAEKLFIFEVTNAHVCPAIENVAEAEAGIFNDVALATHREGVIKDGLSKGAIVSNLSRTAFLDGDIVVTQSHVVASYATSETDHVATTLVS